MDTSHAVAAKGHIANVRAIKLELDDLHAEKTPYKGRQGRISRLNQEIGLGLALAKIEATLDVATATRESAAAFREWTSLADEPIAPDAELVLLQRREEQQLAQCTDEKGCEAQLHAQSCPEADPHAWPASPYGESRVQV